MPLVNFNKPGGLIVTSPTAQNPVEVPVVQVNDPSYNGVTVDTRWNPIASLMVHVAGSPWSVQYYSQVLNTDSSLGGQRPTSAAIHQQYKKIENLVLRVTEPLAVSQNPDDKTMAYVGSAIMRAGVIPNDGDMFTAPIGNGELAIFRVLTTTKKSVFKEAVYEISYEVTTQDASFFADLEEKVVDTLVWREDQMAVGKSPVILKSHDVLLDEATNTFKAVVRQYFERFWSREYSTLLVPGQVRSTYDPMLTSFMTRLLTTDDCARMIQMKVLNVQDDSVFTQNQLWKALEHQDEAMLEGGFSRAGVTETFRFGTNPFFAGIKFSGIPLVVYPKDPNLNWPDLPAPVKTIDGFLTPSVGGEASAFEDSNTGELPQNADVPGLYRVTFDDYYVLSENFYAQTNTQSTLEVQTRQFLKRQALDLEALMKTARAFNRWGVVEQFYYVPLVLALIRCGKFSQ